MKTLRAIWHWWRGGFFRTLADIIAGTIDPERYWDKVNEMNEVEERHAELQPYCGCKICEQMLEYSDDWSTPSDKERWEQPDPDED